MQLSRLCCRTNRLVICLCSVLALLLSGCGGGGGGDSGQVPSHEGPNAGTGSLFISIPTNTGAFQTDLPTVRLEGGSFTPAGSSCNGFSGILPINYRVTWSNNSTGETGVAREDLNCIVIVFTGWDSLYIPLRIGTNSITVTATDGAGNIGRDTIVVTRVPNPSAPTVDATSPTNGATSVGTNSAITVTFSEAMDPASIYPSTILLKDPLNNPVNGSVAYSNNVATLTPLASLQALTVYTATIATDVKDEAGNALATAYTWTFTTGTGPSFGPPSSTSPAKGATCVPTEGGLLATFSEALLPQSLNTSTFLLKDSLNNPIGGNVGLDYLGQAHFLPASALATSSNYMATLTTGLAGLSWNYLGADYTWTFSTQAAGTGVWNATTQAFAPAPRYLHTAVWTGTQMIVWGGYGFSFLGDGARYDPATDSWAAISTVGAPEARMSHVAVWTGSKMIVWGGVRPGAYSNSGAIYDPATDSWTSMSSSGAPSPRGGATAVWTGTEMIVWGGRASTGSSLGDGARYNPVTNSWSAVSATSAPSARSGHTAVWNGSAMLIWGGGVAGGIYTPSSDSWTVIPATGSPIVLNQHVAVWTGNEMIIWGGWDGTNAKALGTGARYNPATNLWQSISSSCAPLARYGHTGVWSGTEMIVWGGSYKVGGRYNPSTETWQATPVVGMPGTRPGHTGIWTGTDLIVWGGRDESGAILNSGGVYRPQ